MLDKHDLRKTVGKWRAQRDAIVLEIRRLDSVLSDATSKKSDLEYQNHCILVACGEIEKLLHRMGWMEDEAPGA